MYLYHFSFKRLPFSLTPDTQLFVPVSCHNQAFNTAKFAVDSGEAFCKIVGEVGTGKTMLCRRLINSLDNKRFIAYIPNSKLNARELKFALAKEIGIRINNQCREDQLLSRIETRLININKQKGPVVVIVDEAQALSSDALEALRLFSNIETEQQKLVQVVLFGQPELDDKLNSHQLRQLKQRIAFSAKLKPLTWYQVHHYVNRRLAVVANQNPLVVGWLFSLILTIYSRGIPRLVHILSHKSLLLAYGQGKRKLSIANLLMSARETDSVNAFWLRHGYALLAVIALTLSSAAMAFWQIQ